MLTLDLERIKLVLVDINDKNGSIWVEILMKFKNLDINKKNTVLMPNDFYFDDICEQTSSVRDNNVKLVIKQYKEIDVKKFPYDSMKIECIILSKQELELSNNALEVKDRSVLVNSANWILREGSIKVKLIKLENSSVKYKISISFTIARNVVFFRQNYLIPIFGICASNISLITVDTWIDSQRLLIVGVLFLAFLMLNLSYISISPKQVTSFTSLFSAGYCYFLLTVLVVMMTSASNSKAADVFDTIFHILIAIVWGNIVVLFHLKNSFQNIFGLLKTLENLVEQTSNNPEHTERKKTMLKEAEPHSEEKTIDSTQEPVEFEQVIHTETKKSEPKEEKVDTTESDRATCILH